MKKIIAIIILSFICINVVKAENMDSGSGRTHCNYTSLQAYLKYELVLDSGECPLMLYNDSNNLREFDLKTERMTAGRSYYYLLDGYEILFDEDADNYEGNIAYAIIEYKVVDFDPDNDNEEAIFLEYFDMNTGNLESKTFFTPPDYGSGTKLINTNFIDEQTNKFKSFDKLYYIFGRYSPTAGVGGQWAEDLYLVTDPDADIHFGAYERIISTGYANRTKLMIIYKTSSSENEVFVGMKTYCGANGDRYTGFLYSNGRMKFYLNGNFLKQFTNVTQFPNYICPYENEFLECTNTGSTYDPVYQYSACGTVGFSQIQQSIEILDGTKFKDLICQVKWAALGVTSNVPTPTSSNIDFTCSTLNGQCTSDCEYQLEQNIGDVFSYCTNDIYTNYLKFNKSSPDEAKNRMNECIAFNNYYNQLINAGIINDFTENCGILSDEMEEKLGWILDIIKIVGPILALGLGTLDFVKVIVNGDADKEMKTAFKNFYTRLIAAALLFLIPFILAFLMDVFLTGKDGYDSDNPYCNIVDWGNNQ